MYISKSELELLLSLLGVRINLLVYCIRYVCVCVCGCQCECVVVVCQ